MSNTVHMYAITVVIYQPSDSVIDMSGFAGAVTSLGPPVPPAAVGKVDIITWTVSFGHLSIVHVISMAL